MKHLSHPGKRTLDICQPVRTSLDATEQSAITLEQRWAIPVSLQVLDASLNQHR